MLKIELLFDLFLLYEEGVEDIGFSWFRQKVNLNLNFLTHDA